MTDDKKKIAVIAGAGPAGLTSAYEFLHQNTDIHPIVFEQSDEIGGISKTVRYNGNRIDIGGHRFFSKNQRVMDWWNQIMPLQGAPALDDLLLGKEKDLLKNGPDPEQQDRVMLLRERVSRIFYLRKFFDYPISLKMKTFTNMGLGRTVAAGTGYLYSCIRKKEEDSLENFYINRFGKPLYSMFFEDYTEKVWGIHPSLLGADWGSQRVKGLSILTILKDMFRKQFSSSTDKKEIETSLIEEFIYPKYGPGQLWETVATDVTAMGGKIYKNTNVRVGAGVCCYEVNGDVLLKLQESLNRKSDFISCFNKKGSKFFVDLKQINRFQLEDIGVLKRNIEMSECCSICHSTEHFSFRASAGKTGRAAIGIMLKS